MKFMIIKDKYSFEKAMRKIALNYTVHILQRTLKVQMKIEDCQLIL